MAKNYFPITIVTGNVSVGAGGVIETENQISSLPLVFLGHDAADKVSRRISEYNGDVEPTTLTETFSERYEKTAGDTIAYSLQKGESISVTITAKNGESIIECSGKRFVLTEQKPTVTLSFTE